MTTKGGPVADLLRRAEDRIGDPAWWCKGQMGRGDGSNCLHGALYYEGRGYAYIDAVRLLHDVLSADYDWWTLAEFNDRESTTHNDVMMVLATALDIAEAEGL